ncbi:MAG: presqualene diphosphate synthase HpnD [Sutterellaceae bacterium]|nr:presqualene diphosphate synthase HpnD [Burkholderiaceae bacterium]MCX7901607.1 presqualene diphosphate synthase HpnD [Burkholderiaceae bacterium]MDW8429515.1 presqualene diphosphate synthase HpnD [Sutterellaceae bacterium]
MTPDEYCQQRAAASGSSFYYAFLFLPPLRRRAITALYAFCREVDDAVDAVSEPSVAQAKLAWWREEVQRLYAGMPQHPVTRALAPHLTRFSIDRERLLQVIEGMTMDLQPTPYHDYAALQRYCHLVAGVVGELAAGIFGDPSPATLTYARCLGQALQLVNILRDVGEDARRGRVYLPLEDLQRFDVRVADLLAARYVPGFAPLMAFEAQRARSLLREALAVLPPAERSAQRPGLIMGALYFALLEELEREQFRVLHQRIALTPLRKLWIAWRTWTFGYPAIDRRE